jgi:nucleoside 2-deoxyribosyltransferase/sugar/nucleoside kinase (ribokinase family)
MTTPANVCLVGQVFVDVTLPTRTHPIKLRAGGIMHAARALWAIDCPYSLAYCGPDYLDAAVQEHVRNYGATSAMRFGLVTGCPNVMLIAEATEAGPQGYEYLLRERQHCDLTPDALGVAAKDATDVIMFPGGFDLTASLPVLGKTTAAIHVDANFEPHSADVFNALGRSFETIILSTSSSEFLDRYRGDYKEVCAELLGTFGRQVLLKENRGGSRLFAKNAPPIVTPAQPRKVQHSVGVGDCFDAIFATLRHSVSDRAAMAYASCIAAEYACTTYPEVFKEAAKSWLAVSEDEIVELAGTVLHWEDRPAIQVYIAAPDFEHVDRRPIDRVAEALKYHNFTPRLPVRENGQMGENADAARRQSLCDADLQILDECQLLLAVMLYDDPGTLIEIGIAAERGVPVIVFDPYGRADNLMLTQLPHTVSSDLDEVITAVFDRAAWVRANG